MKESEERYRIAIEHSNDGVIIIKDGRHAYVNKKFLEMYGYDRPEEIVGKHVSEAAHLHPEDRERFVKLEQRKQEREALPAMDEHRTLRKDGSVLHIEASAAGILYQGGPATLLYLRDVTDRKQAELALRESEEALKSLLNATDAVTFLMSTDGTILATNKITAQCLDKEGGGFARPEYIRAPSGSHGWSQTASSEEGCGDGKACQI